MTRALQIATHLILREGLLVKESGVRHGSSGTDIRAVKVKGLVQVLLAVRGHSRAWR